MMGGEPAARGRGITRDRRKLIILAVQRPPRGPTKPQHIQRLMKRSRDSSMGLPMACQFVGERAAANAEHEPAVAEHVRLDSLPGEYSCRAAAAGRPT